MTKPAPPNRPTPLPSPAPDRSWVATESIHEADRREMRNSIIVFLVVVALFGTIVTLAVRDSDAERQRIAPHEDQCLLTNGRIVHLNNGDACLVDGRVTDRW